MTSTGLQSAVEVRDEIDLLTIFSIIRRYQLFIGIVSLCFAAAAAAIALAMTPMYRAEVVVTEANDQAMGGMSSIANQLGGLASLAGVNIQAGGAGPESSAVLKSRQLIDEFIKRNDLVSTLLVDEKKERKTLWWANRFFKEDVVSIHEDTRAGTTTIAVEWTDPRVASDWANGFVALANELMRVRAMDEATRSIAYLKEQLTRTDIIEIRESINHLIEAQTKTLMLTNARPEYSFKVIDPARPPELKIRPRRLLMTLFGGLIGFLIASIAALVRNSAVNRVRIQAR